MLRMPSLPMAPPFAKPEAEVEPVGDAHPEWKKDPSEEAPPFEMASFWFLMLLIGILGWKLLSMLLFAPLPH